MSSGHIYNPYNSDDDTHKYYIITKKQKGKQKTLPNIRTNSKNGM